jgi:DNA-binding LytR/AlgR family response regulator
MTLYIAICDDETVDLIQEKEMIERVMPSVTGSVNWEIDTFTSSQEMLNSSKTYNMIFLDVEMDGLNGIKTAKALHKKSPISLIFFVTHHEDYMDEALDNYAFRFWTKPINETRLRYSLKSAIKKIASYKKSISVTSSKKTVKILLRNIIYIYHCGRNTHIVTTDETIETYDTFQSVAEQLPYDNFAATHASCYVNLNYVSDYDKRDIICEHNGKIYKPYISTRKYSAFNKRFREWSGEQQ